MNVDREIHNQRAMASAYAALAVLMAALAVAAAVISAVHERRARGARTGQWVPGFWIPISLRQEDRDGR